MATAAIEKTPRVTIADLLVELGDVPPERVRLVPAPGTATEADVIRIWDREKRPCELVAGSLLEKAVGAKESILATIIVARLWAHLQNRDIGFCMGEAGMTRIAPGLVRIPDASFVSWDQVPSRKYPDEPILNLTPDLAVEVISPGNSKAEMDRKLREYFDAGAKLVWYVYPKAKTVKVFTSPRRPKTLREHETLDGGDVLPGFALPLKDLFAKA